MKRFAFPNAFTLAEVLIAMVGSVIVIGALLVGSIGLQRSFHASETYADSQVNQRRLVDFVARDLRRAIGISASGSGGANIRVGVEPVNVDQALALVITLPAYYRSNSTSDSSYDEALPIIASGDRVAYGTESGPAASFTVSFKKVATPDDGVCFVREEGNARQVVVRHAENLLLQVSVAPDGDSCSVAAQFQSTYSRSGAVVAVFDQVMLRNVRID